jgi:hypothetical protein
MGNERRTIPLARQGSQAINCPLAPPEHATVHARALHRACLILGGIEQLASRLQAPKDILELWIRGDGEPPPAVFYMAIEIILLYVDKSATAM